MKIEHFVDQNENEEMNECWCYACETRRRSKKKNNKYAKDTISQILLRLADAGTQNQATITAAASNNAEIAIL